MYEMMAGQVLYVFVYSTNSSEEVGCEGESCVSRKVKLIYKRRCALS